MQRMIDREEKLRNAEFIDPFSRSATVLDADFFVDWGAIMAIPRTNLHNGRVADQVRHNLIGLQLDMIRNAQAHKAMAQAQVPPLATVQTFVADCATNYLARLQWLSDMRSDATKRARFVDSLTKMGWVETDVTNVATPLTQAATALRDAPRTSYAEIVSACDSLLAFVDAPDSLWPE